MAATARIGRVAVVAARDFKIALRSMSDPFVKSVFNWQRERYHFNELKEVRAKTFFDGAKY